MYGAILQYLSIGTRFVDPPPPLFLFFNSSLLWDVFIINSVEQLQTLPKTQSEIDISPFLKTLLYSIILKVNNSGAAKVEYLTKKNN